MTPEFKDAMLRSMLVACAPQSVDEVMLMSDALRIWIEHAELRSEVVSSRVRGHEKEYLVRIAAVMALVQMQMPDPKKADE